MSLDAHLDNKNQNFHMLKLWAANVMFAMIGNHPNMAFVVELIAKFYAKPEDVHCNIVRRIMKYM